MVAAVAPDVEHKLRGQGVHAGDAHAVQAAADLVAALFELAAGVEHGQRHLSRRPPLLGVDVNRNTPTVVQAGQRAIFMDDDVDAGAEAGHRLVDGVVDHLIDEVVEPLRPRGADVHGGSLLNRLEPLEHADGRGVIGPRRRRGDRFVDVHEPSPFTPRRLAPTRRVNGAVERSAATRDSGAAQGSAAGRAGARRSPRPIPSGGPRPPRGDR